MSREKFEEWCKSKGTNPGTVAGYLYLEAWLAGRESMRDEAWEKVNKSIVPGELQGNGVDKQAERNGLILAANSIIQIEL